MGVTGFNRIVEKKNIILLRLGEKFNNSYGFLKTDRETRGRGQLQNNFFEMNHLKLGE